ncbi:MAG: YvcK family protein [Chloroflexi bacterium]|nr:YvcK family protein [Chloroflexota bacterium]
MEFEWMRWLRPGLFVKRWLALMIVSLTVISVGIAYLLVVLFVQVEARVEGTPLWFEILTLGFLPVWLRVVLPMALGISLFIYALIGINRSLLGPLVANRTFAEWAYLVQTHRQLRQGIRVVAIGGGTGLPSALRAMKTETSNITAIVAVGDDGGSSGRLRRELGMLPPGDLRNNIVALARDEDLMTQVVNFRFNRGELEGHTFGNIFLAALVETQGSMDQAAMAAGRVLAIQGQVLPCTLDDIHLVADIRDKATGKVRHVEGESSITGTGGIIERLYLKPSSARALPAVMRSIINADLIVIGPGSLYTSIITNLLVNGMPEVIRTSKAVTVYVCNIATQPGETENYTVEDHILAIERHVGEGLVDIIIANNHYPDKNKGPNTIYVQPVPPVSPIYDRYQIIYTDLTDEQRPWRHDANKLRKALLSLNVPSIIDNMDEIHKGESSDYELQSVTDL